MKRCLININIIVVAITAVIIADEVPVMTRPVRPGAAVTRATGTVDELIAQHRELMSKGDIAGAGTVYQRLVTSYSDDHRAWWYSVAMVTRDFTLLMAHKSSLDPMFDLIRQNSTPEVFANYKREFDEFMERMEQKLDDGLIKEANGGEPDWEIETLKETLGRTQPRAGAKR